MLINDNHIVLGFDIRGKQKVWPIKRRNDFLFRTDVVMPLSVDLGVWPSLSINHAITLDKSSIYQDLWECLDDLILYIHNNDKIITSDRVIIMVTLLLSTCNEAEKSAWFKLLQGVKPLCKENNVEIAVVNVSDLLTKYPWKFLGYDIASLGSISALTNCGFLNEIESVTILRKEWRQKLNHYHLFDEVIDAVKFKDISNIRVPEHAFFSVFGLWLLQDSLVNRQVTEI